ncbi:unnamed protein product, partial [Rotaria sp. Silwood1]
MADSMTMTDFVPQILDPA